MAVYLHHIETLVPSVLYTQAAAAATMRSWFRDEKQRRAVSLLAKRSAIDQRYSVCPDFLPGAEPELYRPAEDGTLIEPTTGQRNAVYAREGARLAVEVARRALDGRSGFSPKDVTHLVFVSCTGFCNPGPDYHVLTELGLPDTVQRYTLGFMGCCASLPALRMAQHICDSDAEAVVLVLSVELCSLHLSLDGSADALLANTLFADGAAAAVVAGRTPSPDRAAYELSGFWSTVVPESEGAMAWTIGDQGFRIVLSGYVPEVIGSNIRGLVEPLVVSSGMDLEAVDLWAIHPGGRAVLDAVQTGLGLGPADLAVSREVLREYGNMSSATILFVLRRCLDRAGENATLCALAFGPGLTVEGATLERKGAVASPVAAASGTRAEPA